MTDQASPNPKTRSLDPEALLREGAWIRRLAWSLVRDDDAADDLAQDVLTLALERPPKRFREAHLRGWLTVLTHRLAARLRFREAHRRSVEVTVAYSEDQAEAQAGETTNRLDMQGWLTAEVNSLAEPHRTALVMRYFDEMTASEIGARLGISAETARKRVSRGLALLRLQLDGKRARSDWLAALLPISRLPQRSAVTAGGLSFSTSTIFLLMKTKLAFAVLIALMGGLLFLLQSGDERHGDLQLVEGKALAAVDLELALNELQAVSTLVGSESVEDNLLGSRRAIVLRGVSAQVHVTHSAGAGDSRPTLAWVDAKSRVHVIELDERGVAPRPEGSENARFFSYAEGLGCAFVQGGPGLDELRLELDPGHRVLGRVTEDGGTPLRTLALSVTRSMHGSGLGREEHKLRTALADCGALRIADVIATRSDGSFEIDGVPGSGASTLRLPETHLRMVAADRITHPDSLDFQPSDGELFLRLARIPSVSGRVLWADDLAPVTDRSLWIRMESRDGARPLQLDVISLDDGGFFELPLELGKPAVSLSSAERAGEVRARNLTFGLATEVTFGSDQSPENMDARCTMPIKGTFDLEGGVFPMDLGVLLAERPFAVSIKVVDEAGAPIADAVIASSMDHVRTDIQGLARIECAQGEQLQAIASGFSPGSLVVSATSAEGQEPLHFRLVRGVSFAVEFGPEIDALWTFELAWDETPFENHGSAQAGLFEPMPVRLHRAYHGRGPSWTHKEGAPGVLRLPIPDQGMLVIPGLRPGGVFQVRLVDRLRQVLAKRDVVAPAVGESLVVNLKPDDRAYTRLQLRVLDIHGAPIEDATVFVRGARQMTGLTFGCPAGERLVPNVASGLYEIEGKALGYMSQSLESVEVGGAEQIVQFRLALARSLIVHCQDADGVELRPRSLRLESAQGWQQSSWLRPDATQEYVLVPNDTLTVIAKIGTRTYSAEAELGEQQVTVQIPNHERVSLLVTRAGGSTFMRESLRLEIHEAAANGGTQISVGLDANDTAPTLLADDLLPGVYHVVGNLKTYRADGAGWAEERVVYQGDIEVRKGAANRFELELVE